MKVAILQSNYIPWRGYFDLIHDADVFVFYDCVQYTKNDWRNRNIIYTRNGKQWLTIPVSSDAVKGTIDEVQLINSRWQQKHHRALFIGYKQAPFFPQLEELANEFLLARQWTSLSELNKHLIMSISRRLGCKTKFVNARELSPRGNRVERLIDILRKIGASHYISGKAAAGYLFGKEALFHEHGVELLYKEYAAYKPYRQLADPFEQSVSILDMVANLSWLDIPSHIWSSHGSN